jgi:hypothetical protein
MTKITELLDGGAPQIGDSFLIARGGDNFRIDGLNLAGLKGATGDKGPTGDRGLTGLAGSDGAQVRNGAGAPAAGFGNVGDFYINTTDSSLYGPKSSSSGWGLSTSLVGPRGLTGLTGTAGTNGQGVPTGGTTGQVLTKTSATDYAASWQTPSTAGSPTSSKFRTRRRYFSDFHPTVYGAPSIAGADSWQRIDDFFSIRAVTGVTFAWNGGNKGEYGIGSILINPSTTPNIANIGIQSNTMEFFMPPSGVTSSLAYGFRTNNTLTSTTAAELVFMGISANSTPTQTSNDKIGFLFDATSSKIKCVSFGSAGTGIAFTTSYDYAVGGTPVARDYRIVLSSTEAKFYIDGTLVYTTTALNQLPDPSVAMGLVFFYKRNASQITLNLDYIEYIPDTSLWGTN